MVSEPQGGVSKKYECRAAVAMATLERLIDSPAVRIYPGAPHERASSKIDGERGTTQVLGFWALQPDNPMFLIHIGIHFCKSAENVHFRWLHLWSGSKVSKIKRLISVFKIHISFCVAFVMYIFFFYMCRKNTVLKCIWYFTVFLHICCYLLCVCVCIKLKTICRLFLST